MRKINKIIIHCSATPPKMDIGVKTIRRWHISKSWSDIGYHFVIRRNGKLETGRPIEVKGAHCLEGGGNNGSIGICLIGGINNTIEKKPENNFTKAQFKTLEKVVNKYDVIYDGLDIHGHNEFSKKACPSFNVQTWLKLIEKKEAVIKKPVVKKNWWRFWE